VESTTETTVVIHEHLIMATYSDNIRQEASVPHAGWEQSQTRCEAGTESCGPKRKRR
jgi:hypothetical protein